MTIYYSDSAKGFFDTKLKGTILPDDAVEITPQDRQQLLDQEKQGLEIAIGQNGRPTTRPKEIPVEQRQNRLRVSVDSHINLTAINYGFKSTLDAISYADEPTDPRRQALGQAIRSWRSACMLELDTQLQSDPLPNENQLIARLPNFVEP